MTLLSCADIVAGKLFTGELEETMPRPRIDDHRLSTCSSGSASRIRVRGRALIAATAIATAFLVAACASQSFQQAPPPPMPTPPPLNAAKLLNGNWMASYPQGPLRVVISLDPMFADAIT